MITKEYGPITRHTLALYAGGSGDHNPLHVDTDFARDVAGMEDVIGHGMLTMAFLSRMLTEEFEAFQVKTFEARFVSPSRPGDLVICHAAAVESSDGEGTWLQLKAENQDGRVLAAGHAVLIPTP